MNERQKKAAVIVPTYNEEANIGRLLDVFFSEIFLKMGEWDMRVIVVDGNSRDNTVSLVRERMNKWPAIHLIEEREKSGLGGAYMKGIRRAMELDADAFIEFDADFQHSPDTIPMLLARMDDGYDYVVGSRNMEGGGEEKNRNFFRSFLTRFGGCLARFILFFPGRRFRQVTDPTSGLKCTRLKDAVGQPRPFDCDPSRLYSRKFGYKVQLLGEELYKGARYAEIPIQFGERTAGKSKIEAGTSFEILRACLLTRLHERETIRFIRFGTVGFIGYLINAFFIAILPRFTNIEPLVWAVSTEAAIISNFALNNIWTFGSRRISGRGNLARKFLQFNVTSAGALAMQTILGTFAVYLFGAEYRQIILPAIILIAVVPYNWHMYRRYIWRKNPLSSEEQA